jgi:hypothetical protein
MGWDSPLGAAATVWPIVPDSDDRWCVWSNRCNANRQGKPKYTEDTCSSAPHDLTQARTLVGSRRLTAWAMARPWTFSLTSHFYWLIEWHCWPEICMAASNRTWIVNAAVNLCPASQRHSVTDQVSFNLHCLQTFGTDQHISLCKFLLPFVLYFNVCFK